MSGTAESQKTILPSLTRTIERLITEFEYIPSDRKQILKQLSQFVQTRRMSNRPVYLNFICTHNSRRSHIAQLWAQASSYYYGVDNVHCFSGGTEATAFNPRAVKAMRDAGFNIITQIDGANPVYNIRFSDNAPSIKVFSKKYDDPVNKAEDFAAIMTCSHADDNCPFIPGASARIAITYDDPKNYDDTPQEVEKYKERVHQIGREILFSFSEIK